MHPEICQIGPITIYSYGLLLVIAFITATQLAGRQARKEGIDPEVIFNFAFFAFIFGVLGARIFFVLENLSFYLSRPLEIIMLQHGGLSWFGGLFLGTFVSILYLKKQKVRILVALDLIVPYLALAQSIGRIGCFLNGCCYGRVFGIIPTQIASSFLLLIIFLILRFFQSKKHTVGTIFLLYLMLYSLKRFFIEFWRADNPVVFWGLTLFQVLSLGLLILALGIFVLIRNKRN